MIEKYFSRDVEVLNLIITGMPSILKKGVMNMSMLKSFKPYYNWNTFNTLEISNDIKEIRVLNLVISGIPSIL